MPLSLPEFWNAIVDCEVASAATAREWAAQWAREHQGSLPPDSKGMALWLIKKQLLTEYQARYLVNGKGKKLLLGPWLITSPATPPWSDWYRVRSRADRNVPEMIARSHSQLSPNASARLKRLEQVDSPLVIRQKYQKIGGENWLITALPEGELLSNRLARSALSESETLALCQQLATALHALHNHQLAAGLVHPERVWMDRQGSTLLIVDPLKVRVNPLTEGNVAEMLDGLKTDPAAAYAAPEFSMPGAEPTRASDIYALGCLLFRAHFGEPPFAASNIDGWLAEHGRAWPQRLDDSSHLKCLIAHSIAKNPDARFADAQQLARVAELAINNLLRAKTPDSSSQVPGNQVSANQVSVSHGAVTQSMAPEAKASQAMSRQEKPSPLSPSPPDPKLAAKSTTSKPPSLKPAPPKSPAASSPNPKPTPTPPATTPPATPPPISPPPTSSPPTAPPPTAPPPAATPTTPTAAPPLVAPPAVSPPALKPSAPSRPSAKPPPIPNVANTPAPKPPAANPPATISPAPNPPAPNPPAPKPVAPKPVAPKPSSPTPSLRPQAASQPITEPKSNPAEPPQVASSPLIQSTPNFPDNQESPPSVVQVKSLESVPVKMVEKEALPYVLARDDSLLPTNAQNLSVVRRTRPRKKKKEQYKSIVIGAMGLSVIMVLIALLTSRGSNRDSEKSAERPRIPIPPPQSTVNSAGAVANKTPQTTGEAELVDDPQLLFAPPGKSDRVSLEMIPPGSLTIIMLRPARILASAEGRSLAKTFAPEIDEGMQTLQRRAGVAAEEIDRLIIALAEGTDAVPKASYAVRLRSPIDLAELKKRWGTGSEVSQGTRLLLPSVEKGDAYYVSEGTSIENFAFGTPDAMREVAENEGGAIPLPRVAEQLWNEVREGNDLALLVNPNLLFGGGRRLLADYAPNLIEPLQRFLNPDVSAGLVTMSFHPQWFGEIRLSPGPGIPVANLVTRFRNRLDGISEEIERFFVSTNPHPSWRALAIRLPSMFRSLATMTRVQGDEQFAVANFYLPPHAAGNILLGSWLAANTTSSSANPMETPKASKPMSFEEILNRPITVDVVQEDLHVAISLIEETANQGLPPGSEKISIKLVGNDLEQAGITQNQAVRDFQQRNLPLRAVLTAICLKAHTPTLTNPKDPAQRLVWAIGPDPKDPKRQSVLITTRNAARKYKLAPEFGE